MIRRKKKREYGAKRDPRHNAILNESAQDVRRKREIEKILRNSNKSKEAEKNFPITNPDLSSVTIPENVQDIFTALQEPSSQKIISFDEALEKLKKSESLQDDETIVYIGGGYFAVVAYLTTKNKKRETTIVEIRRKIEFEEYHNHLQWRAKLCYDLSLSYEPNPEPISELYTEQELLTFPNFS